MYEDTVAEAKKYLTAKGKELPNDALAIMWRLAHALESADGEIQRFWPIAESAARTHWAASDALKLLRVQLGDKTVSVSMSHPTAESVRDWLAEVLEVKIEGCPVTAAQSVKEDGKDGSPK